MVVLSIQIPKGNAQGNDGSESGVAVRKPSPKACAVGYRFSSLVRRLISTSSSIVTNISVDRAYIVGMTPNLVELYTMQDRFGICR